MIGAVFLASARAQRLVSLAERCLLVFWHKLERLRDEDIIEHIARAYRFDYKMLDRMKVEIQAIYNKLNFSISPQAQAAAAPSDATAEFKGEGEEEARKRMEKARAEADRLKEQRAMPGGSAVAGGGSDAAATRAAQPSLAELAAALTADDSAGADAAAEPQSKPLRGGRRGRRQ